MHTNINNNALKNTRVNAFFQLYYQVTVIILKYSNSTQLEISSSAEVAVVFRKLEKHNTDLRSPSGVDESCRWLSFIVSKPCKARGVRHVPNVHTMEICVWRAGIAEVSVYRWGMVSVKQNTWWGSWSRICCNITRQLVLWCPECKYFLYPLNIQLQKIQLVLYMPLGRC